jgi:hypothetical protein
LSGEVHYSGYRFLRGFQVKMKGSAVTMRFLVASEFVLTGRLASIGGHPGNWREQCLALIERVVDGVGNQIFGSAPRGWQGRSGLFPYCRQTAPYSPELEPDIVLTQPDASGVDEILYTLW